MSHPDFFCRSAARLPFALAAVSACFLPAGVSAQTAAQAGADKALSPVVVTATRNAQPFTDVLADTVVITGEQIQRSGETSLVALLQRQRGIEITQNGGPGTNATIFLRGTDNRQNVVLIDGVRTSSVTAGGATWAAIPLSSIERIEIVYGPMSSLYGADAVGGVIQIFTKRGEGTPNLAAGAEVGRYRTRRFDANIAGSTGGEHNFRYALGAGHDESDGFSATVPAAGSFTFNPDRDGYKRDSANGQFSFDLAKGHEVGVTFLNSRLSSQIDAGPGADDRTVTKLENVAVYSKNQFLSWWQSQLQLSQSQDKSASTSFGGSYFNSKQTVLAWQNDLSLGTDLLQLVAERREEKVDANPGQGERDLNRERFTNALAVAYQLRRGAHLGSLSLRRDNSSQYGGKTTGSLGYGYRITSALRANASYGTSFRAPTFNDLYYPGSGIQANAPERGRNAELGLAYDDGVSKARAVYYRNRLTDLLVYAGTCPVEQATHPFGCTYNVNQATLRGLSLEGSTALGQWTLRGSLDIQDPHDDTNDRQLVRRARRHGTAGVDYRMGQLSTGAELVLSSKRYDDQLNQQPMGGYGLVNLVASYDLAPGWTVLGRLDNALDKKYELAKNYATAGRSLFVGVRYAMR